jgi:hypothetical protein
MGRIRHGYGHARGGKSGIQIHGHRKECGKQQFLAFLGLYKTDAAVGAFSATAFKIPTSRAFSSLRLLVFGPEMGNSSPPKLEVLTGAVSSGCSEEPSDRK